MSKFVCSMLFFFTLVLPVAAQYPHYQQGGVEPPPAMGVHQWNNRLYQMGPFEIPRNTASWDAPGYHRTYREGAVWKWNDETQSDPYGNSVRQRNLKLFGFLNIPLTTQKSAGYSYYVQPQPTYYYAPPAANPCCQNGTPARVYAAPVYPQPAYPQAAQPQATYVEPQYRQAAPDYAPAPAYQPAPSAVLTPVPAPQPTQVLPSQGVELVPVPAQPNSRGPELYPPYSG